MYAAYVQLLKVSPAAKPQLDIDNVPGGMMSPAEVNMTTLAFAVFVAGHFWICRDALRIPLRPLVWTLARCLVAVAVMAGVLALFGTSSLSAVEWVAGAVAAVLAYAIALRLLGEVSGSEVARARRAIRALAARRRTRSG